MNERMSDCRLTLLPWKIYLEFVVLCCLCSVPSWCGCTGQMCLESGLLSTVGGWGQRSEVRGPCLLLLPWIDLLVHPTACLFECERDPS